MTSDNNNGGLGLSFKREGRFIAVSGRIDEFAEYAPLLAMDPPLKLILRDVRALNSHGIRKWIQFVRAWGLNQIEFHECPVVFVDAVNMIGDLVSANGNMKRIKSVIVPVHCGTCNTVGHRVVSVSTVHYRTENDIDVPLTPCTRCKRPVEEQVILEDYFWFVQVDDAG